METLHLKIRITTFAASLAILATTGLAADSTAPGTTADQSVNTTSATPSAKLPYGVDDVLKLSRAKINDDIVVNYVQNSGTVYNLGSGDIVYLRQEGVSDRVINAMLDQRKNVATSSAQAQTQTAPPATAMAPPAAAPSDTTVQPAPVYVQSPPPQPAPSTVYVIPYPQATYAYYGGHYPYYYYRPYYPYYYGPRIAVGFGFGGRWHHHRW